MLLRAENLAKRFGGVHAVQDVSFELAPGTVHAIIGPNGAGKTTLLNMLTGIYLPSAGRVFLGERELTGQPPHRYAAAGIGRTFQNLQIFFNMSALENVMAGRWLHERAGFAAAAAAPAAARARRAPLPSARRCSSSISWASRAGPTLHRMPCPTARSSAWRSRARSPPSPGCCSSTSPPPASTRPRRARSTA